MCSRGGRSCAAAVACIGAIWAGYVDRSGAGWFHDTIEHWSATRVADTAVGMIGLLIVGDRE